MFLNDRITTFCAKKYMDQQWRHKEIWNTSRINACDCITSHINEYERNMIHFNKNHRPLQQIMIIIIKICPNYLGLFSRIPASGYLWYYFKKLVKLKNIKHPQSYYHNWGKKHADEEIRVKVYQYGSFTIKIITIQHEKITSIHFSMLFEIKFSISQQYADKIYLICLLL